MTRRLLPLALALSAACVSPEVTEDCAETGCAAGQICQPDGTCAAACVPRGCAADSCGRIGDGCGGEVECGDCDGGDVCVSNVCCTPQTCEERGAQCGAPVENTCMTTLDCGTCEDGETCTESFRCSCTPEPLLLAELDRDDGPPLRANISTASPLLTVEGGRTILTFSTSRWDGDTSYTALARVELVSPALPDLATLEMIEGTAEGIGWAARQSVSADGLELFFDSSRPNGDWRDPEIYAAHRSSADGAWSVPVVVESVGSSSDDADTVGSPQLLPDGRTLLYGRAGVPALATRASTTPGDLAFVPEAGAAFEDPLEDPSVPVSVGNFVIDCDRTRILYTREWSPAGTDLRQISFQLDPVRFGTPEPYARFAVPPLGDGSHGHRVLRFAEAPDCGGVYLGNFAADLYYLAASCGG